MAPRAAPVLLAVVGAGAFLSGLELMITAVALPAIVNDLADWTELRAASWIINGYLVVSIVVMPIAGRLADRFGVRRVFLWAVVVFVVGSVLAGAAWSLPTLIAARLLQAVGGGCLIPVATAAAPHLYPGASRARALGFIGAVTFLGMATGPFVGAWILEAVHPASALESLGMPVAVSDALAASWRYVFYLNVPVGLSILALGWAGMTGWSTPRRRHALDLVGAAATSVALSAVLLLITLAGSGAEPGAPSGPAAASDPGALLGNPIAVAAVLAVTALVATGVAAWAGRRADEPFIDPAWFRHASFTAAALVSLLTGYAFATAIIGGAVFVDRVLYGGPDVQRIALGALAAATAVGALGSGLVLRVVGLRITTLIGLAASLAALVAMAAWTPGTPIGEVAAWLALFGLGFGLTVTPRSEAAVEALGDLAYGVASSTVTVARMLGMALGLAALTAFGSTVIDRLWAEIQATPDAYKAFIPPELRDRAFTDGLVVQALETWASGEAARILVGVFLVAAGVLAVAVVPTLGLRRAAPDASPGAAGATRGG